MSFAGTEELAALLGEVEAITRSAQEAPANPADGETVSHSFGISGLAAGDVVSSAEEKVSALVDSIKATLAMLAPVAHLETTVQGFTAKTAIRYSGFAASVWSSGTTPKLVDAHLGSLQRAFAFRSAAIAVVAAVGNAVVAISVAVGNPLTVWHAVKSAGALKLAVDRLAAAVAAQGSPIAAIA